MLDKGETKRRYQEAAHLTKTENLPMVKDYSLFTSGRVRGFSFVRHFESLERESGLKETLALPESLSGILNWMPEDLRMDLSVWCLVTGCGSSSPAHTSTRSGMRMRSKK